MLTEYAGWQISDEKQRAIEERIIKQQLLEAAKAAGGYTPGWLRLQLHYMGVRMERFGERMQIEYAERRAALADDGQVGASAHSLG